MTSIMRRMLWVAVCVLCGSVVGRGAERAVDQDLVRTVLDARRDNDAKLGPVALVLNTKTVTLRSDQAPPKRREWKTRNPKTGDEGTVVFEMTEKAPQFTERVLIAPDFFERTRRDAQGEVQEVWQRENDEWLEVTPDRIIERRQQDLPGIGQLDPREMLLQSLELRLESLLQSDHVKSAQRIDHPHYGSGSIEVELTLGGQLLAILFGANAHYLPVTAELSNPNGQTVYDARLEYTPAGRGDALLFRSAKIEHNNNPDLASSELAMLIVKSQTVTVEKVELLDSDKFAAVKYTRPRPR